MAKTRFVLPPSEGGKLMKMWYRIGEAAELIGEEPHVLRFWESEFRALRPQKSSHGQRVYSRKDIDTALKIKGLLREQRFSIEGAKKRLREGEPAEETTQTQGVVAAETPVPAVLSPVSSPKATEHRAALVELRHDLAAFLARLEEQT